MILTLNCVAQDRKTSYANGIRISYLEWGDGEETIVMIHGLYDSAVTWNRVAILLARRFRVIAVDRRGAGESERVVGGYETENLAKDVKALLDRLDLERVHIVGHSAGGAAALTFAANYPKKVISLVLLEGGFWKKREPGELPKCEEVDRNCLINRAATDASYKYDSEPLFSKVEVPTLLVLARPPKFRSLDKGQRKIFSDVAREVKAVSKYKLRNGDFAIIKNSGHWIQKDQPVQLARKMLKFVNRCQ